ncbi:plasmid partitioning protein RepB C-terminal domain-containing protein [Mesorhizobium loti]|uniref:plasmid partitioning protein RepB C-terminal domain-containing protein n=1 Tax=Rhizobium loti TaxID=381 RepID=UPI0013765B78|nr:plasmid partitioning protein RepB C-terminal domain-containing protein [Mesorhizobium loti]
MLDIVIVPSYHQGGLELVAARGYLNRLMDNAPVVRYLARTFPEALSRISEDD